MTSAAAEHTASDGILSSAFIFKRQRCLHFRRQTGGGCLVVVKLSSLVVSSWGHRPPTNATNQCFDPKGHTINTNCACPHYLCLCYLEQTGAHESMRWESALDLDSSCLIMVCSNHGTKLCGMLITYADHVWADLNSWSFRRET